MHLIFFGLALLTFNSAISGAKPSCVYKSETQDKMVVSQMSEYEVFAQKYESTFGEKPSAQIWNLDKETCRPDSSCTADAKLLVTLQ